MFRGTGDSWSYTYPLASDPVLGLDRLQFIYSFVNRCIRLGYGAFSLVTQYPNILLTPEADGINALHYSDISPACTAGLLKFDLEHRAQHPSCVPTRLSHRVQGFRNRNPVALEARGRDCAGTAIGLAALGHSEDKRLRCVVAPWGQECNRTNGVPGPFCLLPPSISVVAVVEGVSVHLSSGRRAVVR